MFLAVSAGLSLASFAPGFSVAGEIADAFRRQAASPVVSRDVSLRDLGISQPISLNVLDSVREIYFPVPPGIPLVDATLAFDGTYRRGEGGRTTFIASLDGYAVSSRAFTGESGSAAVQVGVDGSPRSNGFVRLGLKWSSFVAENICDNEQAIGNILQILPSTMLRYSYDTSLVGDLATAWSALPHAVTILVSGDRLETNSYDSAWRMGVALERAGKKVSIEAPPQPGDIVDLSAIKVPEALRMLPAFAALSSGGRHTVANAQEAAALLLLDLPGSTADIVIVDGAFSNLVDRSFEELKQQAVPLDSEAARALDDVRAAFFAAIPRSMTGAEFSTVRFDTFAGRSLIAIGSGAGAQAAGLFDRAWQQTAISRSLVVNEADRPAAGAERLSLKVFGRQPVNIDVVEHADWSAVFDLADAGAPGQIPAEIDVDVSIAPGADGGSPVASVYINDYLLGAKRLEPDGSRQTIVAWIPHYALMSRNILRVQFLRQRPDTTCTEKSLPFPASVLPSSRFRMEPAPEASGFSTLVAWLPGEAALFVPKGWMERSPSSLPGVIRVATASGVSPLNARLVAGEGNTAVKPDRPFIAFDTAVEGVGNLADVRDGRVVLTEGDGSVFYDVAGLNGLAVVQVTAGNGHSGLIYRTAGPDFIRVGEPFQWGKGNIAVIGERGILAQVNTNKASDFLAVYEDEPLSLTKPVTWVRHLPLIAVVGVAGFALLLLRARQVRRRHASSE